jgi:hypothetical protein
LLLIWDRTEIRITEVKVEKHRVLVHGDAAAAYEPELGVKKFVREFEYMPGTGFMVRDEVQTEKRAILTSVLHADERFEKEAANRFRINAAGAKLPIELAEPKEAQMAIEANALIGAGRPGSVDKGERQERGQKLLISTAAPTTTARVLLRLKIEE